MMMPGPRVLVIDSDRAVRTLLRRVLSAASYQTQDTDPGEAALRCIAEREFDLLIVDVNSSTDSGPEFVPIVRKLSVVPILVLCISEDLAIRALDTGADDYVRKPLSIKELLARVKNTLRRTAREAGKPVQLVIGDLDLVNHRVGSRGQDVHLPVRLYEVLKVLAEGAGKVLTHEEIIRAVWGPRRVDRLHYLRVAIQELRRRLEPDPDHPR
jgi:two-component system, OmpR family, KDP operon response regulator KdpE